jgi:hypothetical protein
MNPPSQAFRRIQSWLSHKLVGYDLEFYLYLVFASFCTLYAAKTFFDVRALHLGWAEAARMSSSPNSAVAELAPIRWSAPLDDTFIHFDFARSFARLRPFEWAPGGGYSSGATSWLYPFLLSFGILFGFDGQRLGEFSDLLACVTVFGFFYGARRLFSTLPRFYSYALPPTILLSGVLGWSLWSGMELGLFLAIWGGCAYYFMLVLEANDPKSFRFARSGLSVFGLLLVLTRPEALYCVGVFALFAIGFKKSPFTRNRLREIGLVLAPAIGFTVFRALLNRVLTGSFADAGALVKLETLHPFHDSREIALRWLSHVGFQFSRITIYHTSDDANFGFQIWLLAALGFFPRKTRLVTSLLWLSALGWILIVAQNEYVRYQNDRYTMPAVVWLLIAAALGTAGVLDQCIPRKNQPVLPRFLPIGAAVVTLAVSFTLHQLPRLEQQKWLFGRACRNIAEQQIRTGQLLGAGHFGHPHRVLVGDAGAIPYFSQLKALDAIGLGGTHGLPFSKAVRLGVGATVELIERLAPSDRPDILAIYPSWWDLLPVWFGYPLGEIRISGNVICGASNKAVYLANWRGLDESPPLHVIAPNRQLVDELDFADVVSETAHDYELSVKHAGYVVMKILPNLADPQRELFDAGRLVFSNTKTSFKLRGFKPRQPVELTFRAAPADVTRFDVYVDGRRIDSVELLGGRTWQEPRVTVPSQSVRDTMRIEIRPNGTENILYHVWATTTR